MQLRSTMVGGSIQAKVNEVLKSNPKIKHNKVGGARRDRTPSATALDHGRQFDPRNLM